MKCNVGRLDRTARIVIGIALLLAGLLVPALGLAWRIVILILAAVALVTAALRYCPASALFGIDTCEEHGSKGNDSGTHSLSG